MTKIVYRQMPAPREVPQQIPAPGQKLGCKSPRGGGRFWCKSRGCAGGWLWLKLIPALINSKQEIWLLLASSFHFNKLTPNRKRKPLVLIVFCSTTLPDLRTTHPLTVAHGLRRDAPRQVKLDMLSNTPFQK